MALEQRFKNAYAYPADEWTLVKVKTCETVF